ncbi:FMN-binding protein [Streptomyces ureilyticus]|uniref:FMN-binding protein n=1 Tax=Streptomyces ureilyticus TaxID=1775131 RepID=A0ABX0DZ65_9ACTN|nr:FMN-binding protein [Streptomyces ureilyticus]NGO45563.1 FMN-binding protein [Streptomyces ureilyticus]
MRKKHPFRNAVLAAAATASGIVLLLALKPTTDPALARGGTTPTAQVTTDASASSSQSSSHSPSASASSSKTPEKQRAPSSASASASPSASASRSVPATPAKTSSASAPRTTSAAPTTRTVTGATAQTKYGPVQVRITLSGDRITRASAVQSPSSPPRSEEISSTASPKLNQETLEAQSADIDTVSGATYTSEGYKQSLQSALDQAGV